MSRLTGEREREIYTATVELVATRGFASTTIDAIAEHAHCSKATIYRQWDGKVSLLVEALAALKPQPEPVPDTGTLVGDLHALVASRVDRMIDSGRVAMAILHAAQQDDELREALRARLGADDHRNEVEQVLDRAVARGEIAADLPVIKYLPLILLAPVVLQPLCEDRLDAASVNNYLDATLVPLLGLAAD